MKTTDRTPGPRVMSYRCTHVTDPSVKKGDAGMLLPVA